MFKYNRLNSTSTPIAYTKFDQIRSNLAAIKFEWSFLAEVSCRALKSTYMFELYKVILTNGSKTFRSK